MFPVDCLSDNEGLRIVVLTPLMMTIEVMLAVDKSGNNDYESQSFLFLSSVCVSVISLWRYNIMFSNPGLPPVVEMISKKTNQADSVWS